MSTNNGLSLSTIVTIFLISLGLVVSSSLQGTKTTRDLSKANTFKNEVLTGINAAENMYSEISMVSNLSGKYLKGSDLDNYQGMCVTFEGLVNNGYLMKDLTDFGGVILMEVPFDGGQTMYTVWAQNGSMAINGVEKNLINSLKKDTSNDKDDDNINGGKTVITTNLTGVKKIIEQTKNNKLTTIKTVKSKGGTGESYTNIECISEMIE